MFRLLIRIIYQIATTGFTGRLLLLFGLVLLISYLIKVFTSLGRQ